MIRFTVRNTGSYQMTIMSETPLNDGTGDILLNVLDVTSPPSTVVAFTQVVGDPS